ncbi:hypothetical protein, partial [Prevotellamassilia timonensis]
FLLLPLQGATASTRDTQGVASLALGYEEHWAFSPPLLNPSLFTLWGGTDGTEGHYRPVKRKLPTLTPNATSNGGDASRVGKIKAKAHR